MEPNRLRQRLRDGEFLLGFSNSYPSAALIETVGAMWDFIWIDGQHGQFSYDAALTAIRTADLVGVDTLLRVPGQEHGLLGLYADMFPSALMVPMVNNPEEAKAVVNATRFPPLGNRSYGGRRPIDVIDRNFYLENQPVLVAQIETPQAVDHAAAIAAVEGVDALLLGADDLKIQAGLSVNAPSLETEIVVEAMERVARAAKEAGKAAGCVTPSPELVQHCAALGYQLLIAGSDVGFLRKACQDANQRLREALGM